MNGYSLFEHTLQNILRSVNPLEEDWSMRFQLIHELRAVVESIEILRGGCRKLQFITNARVPILKFQGNYNISCDISINNLSGQMKSKILYWINMIDGRFRDMVLLVKEWAKAHNVNDSKTGTLNSYSLSLLVVFHFQTCVPAILPPLKEIYPGNMVDDLTGVRASAEKFIEETCAMNINRLMSNKSRAINKSSLSELFISFIVKFCDISSRASAQAISPFTGQWEDIASNLRWLPKTYTIFVEDPFEQPINSARGVSSKQLTRIEDAFRRTHFVLISSNQNENEVISTLVRPYVSKFVTRTPGNQNNYSRNGLRPQLQTQRAMKPPLQAQHQLQVQRAIYSHQLQDKKMNRNQNSTAQGPAQAIRVQTQAVWRPKSDRGV
ncbi:protein HESO1 isoform X2 [Capsicum annuum]|uniref:protein HESO1 isoform X2 n=1 Tax=Capsicum annuum TaxID=4072 RepID=UPI001FB17369|nr:protein HESO1 isoform X2 [Capsicum annuum]